MRTAKFVAALLSVAWITTDVAHSGPLPSAGDYYVSPEVMFGEKLLLEIAFTLPPTSSLGAADMLEINMGSTSLWTQSVTTALYVGGQFLGSSSFPAPIPFGLFAMTGSPLIGISYPLPITSVNANALESLFNGSEHGFLSVTPHFSDPAGHARFSGWFAHAGTATGITAGGVQPWEDIFPAAALVQESVVPANAFVQIPEPTTLALLGLGLAGLVFSRRKQ